ncbi:hypothetical protein [Clostridium culturomicium]|uniref:hypothetical protein n=1 Tax=Clostridium culturomicium TaxID=1499683 RepID=UPI0038573653
MNKNVESVRNIEDIVAENILLKKEIIELRQHLSIQKNWTSIREGYLLPMLEKKYGNGKCVFSSILVHVANIVKEYLGISKLTEITEVNYDYAKELSISIVNTLCNYENHGLRELQKGWVKYK